MLTITIPAVEMWDERTQSFIQSKEQTLTLEHSLVSLSKWESKWCKSFLSTKNLTNEEILDYIKCMTITPNVKPETYLALTEANVKSIIDYINAPMTATVIREDKSRPPNREVITSELIYYWMIAHQIPFDREKWHLNRLLTLIKVCDVKSKPPKKMSTREVMSQYASLNAARKKQLNTKG